MMIAVMENSWQLLLIISLWACVEGVRECVMLENWNLEIPDNPIIEGAEEIDPWYCNVTWKKVPQGDPPTVSYKIEDWIDSGDDGGGDWNENRSGSTNLCDSNSETEAGSFAEIARSAVALCGGCPIREGTKSCGSSLFSRFDDCHLIYFDGDLMDNTKKKISLNVHDNDDNQLLTGRLIIPIGGRIYF